MHVPDFTSRLLHVFTGCLAASFFFSCNRPLPESTVLTEFVYLNWEFSKTGDPVWRSATVPGTIHTDLLHHGLIPDPFLRTNEADLQWIGRTDWSYRTTLNPSETLRNADNLELVFHGLDTYAEVLLNGKPVLNADNMFRTWTLDLNPLLIPGDNSLEIRFKNTFAVNVPKWKAAPFRLMAFPNNDQADTMIALYARKAQFHYGWDWGPRLITAGIWKPVELRAWNGLRIEDLHVIPEHVTEKSAVVRTKLAVSTTKPGKAKIRVHLDGKPVHEQQVTLNVGRNSLDESFTITNPKRWWPNGMGDAYLYEYSVSLEAADGSADTKTLKLGVRSIEVDRRADKDGKAFTIKVNGVPVFMKGANHIPEDNFQHRVTPERYERTMKAAADANMNMLRVWGGGIFEDDAFYEAADRHGILIWQDMMFACAMYPGDDAFLTSVRAEVIDNVSRLRNHASIALYCGNNENEIAWEQWGWKPKYSADVQAIYERDLKRLYYETIPEAIAAADSTRFYTPSSPIAGWTGKPNGDGDIHYWGVWHGKEPFANYEKNLARFVSEYGFQSYPDFESLKQFADSTDLQLHSDVMLHHQRCMADDRRDKEYGNRLIQHYMDTHFRTPQDFESFVYVSQLVQALGVEYAVNAHRRAMPYTMGTLFWQINDCWPAASWSSIDYYGKWKAVHYKARNLYKPVLLIPRLENNELAVYAATDYLDAKTATLVVETFTLDGKLVSRNKPDITLPVNQSAKLATFTMGIKGNEPDNNLVVRVSLADTEADAAPVFFHFVEPKDLNLPEAALSLAVKRSGKKVEVTLSANAFAKNVFVSTPGNLLNFSDNYFDLLPGESKTIVAETTAQSITLKAISLRNTY